MRSERRASAFFSWWGRAYLRSIPCALLFMVGFVAVGLIAQLGGLLAAFMGFGRDAQMWATAVCFFAVLMHALRLSGAANPIELRSCHQGQCRIWL